MGEGKEREGDKQEQEGIEGNVVEEGWREKGSWRRMTGRCDDEHALTQS